MANNKNVLEVPVLLDTSQFDKDVLKAKDSIKGVQDTIIYNGRVPDINQAGMKGVQIAPYLVEGVWGAFIYSMEQLTTTQDITNKWLARAQSQIQSAGTNLASGDFLNFFTSINNVSEKSDELSKAVAIGRDKFETLNSNLAGLVPLTDELENAIKNSKLSIPKRMDAADWLLQTELDINDNYRQYFANMVEQGEKAIAKKLAMMPDPDVVPLEGRVLYNVHQIYNNNDVQQKVKDLIEVEAEIKNTDFMLHPNQDKSKVPAKYKGEKTNLAELYKISDSLKSELGVYNKELVTYGKIDSDTRAQGAKAYKFMNGMHVADIKDEEARAKHAGFMDMLSGSNKVEPKELVALKEDKLVYIDPFTMYPIDLNGQMDKLDGLFNSSDGGFGDGVIIPFHLVEEEEPDSLFEEQIAGIEGLLEKLDELNDKTDENSDKFEQFTEISEGLGNLFGDAGDAIQQFAGDSEIGAIAAKGMMAAQQGLAIATGIAQAAAMPFPANIPAIATTVAAIVSGFGIIGSFAHGGIVGGNSFVGDNLMARVNSGEMILNRGQQSNLFNMISSGMNYNSSPQTVVLSTRIRGKDIEISGNNYRKIQNKLG